MARAETGRGARRKDRLASIEFTKLQARQGRFRFPDTQLDCRFQRFKVVDDKSQLVFAGLGDLKGIQDKKVWPRFCQAAIGS